MTGRRALDDAIAARRRTAVVGRLRALAQPRPETPATASDDDAPAERCDLCGGVIPDDHRHLLEIVQRQIVCVCESCWALRAGDPELRPVGTRTAWLDGFALPDDLWASLKIPIGLAFLMRSSATGTVVALYPSPAGATESELALDDWSRMCELNPVLESLETDAEALIVNRLAQPPAYAIAPIDRCYLLVGLVKSEWQGISGGPNVETAIAGFFDELRAVTA